MNISSTNHKYTETYEEGLFSGMKTESYDRGWTKKDKDALKKIVTKSFEIHGEYDWDLIGEQAHRTAAKCRHKWQTVLNPNIKRGRWTESEDNKLKEKFSEYGNDWPRIAEEMDGRTPSQCQERYKLYLDPSINFEDWTEIEDEKLKRAITTIGEGRWSEISEFLPRRTGKQCNYRWNKITRDNENSLKKRKVEVEKNEKGFFKKAKINHELENHDMNYYAKILFEFSQQSVFF